jgi:CubicO group peptidase (beta-lactamase class C family)
MDLVRGRRHGNLRHGGDDGQRDGRETMTGEARAIDVIRRAIGARIFPAAAAEVGLSQGIILSETFGTMTFDPEATKTTHDTAFDLASLTKPIVTTSVVMQFVDTTRIGLDDRVAEFFPEWRGADREAVTVRDLLEHASGLPARLLDAPPATPREFEHDICTMPLEYSPRTRSIYSDLDFILLGLLIERAGGGSLQSQFDAIRRTLSAAEPQLAYTDAPLEFNPQAEHSSWLAPTIPLEDDPRRGRTLVGEVHDSYAAALGGVAGHAGLFGTATSVAAFARAVLRAARGDHTVPAPLSPALIACATRKSTVPGSSRALGWDTMLPTSSCGSHMSPSAFGHTGFTGTSMWIDPARDRYFVLLTNRVCGGGTLDQMRDVRRAFHDAFAE